MNPSTLVLQLNPNAKQDVIYTPDHYEEKAHDTTSPQVESFYAAVSGEDVVGLVSNSGQDRVIVASLVATWIASGYNVQELNRKDMLKKLRIVIKKDDQTDGTGQPAASAPSAAADPQVQANLGLAQSQAALTEEKPAASDLSQSASQPLAAANAQQYEPAQQQAAAQSYQPAQQQGQATQSSFEDDSEVIE